jgi:hypothetical protein
MVGAAAIKDPEASGHFPHANPPDDLRVGILKVRYRVPGRAAGAARRFAFPGESVAQFIYPRQELSVCA